MSSSIIKVPPTGVWTPSVTLFDPSTDTLDLDAQRKYFTYLARNTGLAGLVILGTNAETFLLTREERKQLLQLAKECVEGTGVSIMAGVSGHSVAQVREYVQDALEVGGIEYLLVLPVGYFPGSSGNREVIDGFYGEVAKMVEGKGVGIVLYNFPAVCNGIDLDSDTITRLAKKHDEIVSVKLTCGSVAKITRLAATFSPSEFSVFGGQSDFLLGGLAVGSAGCIAAFGNVFPRTIVKVYDLYQQGKTLEALQLHRKAALAEQALKAGGIASVKYAASVFTAPLAGIEGAEEKMRPRRPYLPPGDEAKSRIREALAEVAEIEKSIVV
ncbi:mitochondrial putative 4-hydroxy-2-oxoglutarate aldolase [Cladorrhinum sp. PSN259]|nr:mitochondrial putative 4-hydroxy-2-oxoglutarate aldolase [Cladorrhinum sp. PSN259]